MRFYLLLFVLFNSAVWADSVTKEGKLQEVILYRNQALVMRTLEVDLKDGIHEIVVSRLPSEIIQSSLYAESSGAEIRGTRMKTKELSEDPEAPVKELDEKIEKISSDISRINRLIQVNQSKVVYLTKQEDFAAATEKQEMTRGVLNPDVVAKITLFHFDQKRELANEEFQLQSDLKKLNKEKDHLQRQRNQLAKTTPRLLEASVFVEKTGQGTAQIKLFYLVQNAGWNPVYNIYSKTGEKNVTTEFNAKIQQFSGENWENVQITLSNATPALSAAAPSLSPFRLSLSTGPSGYVTGDLRAATQNAAKKMSIATQRQMGAQNWDESAESGWAMNSAANEFQNLEIMAKDEDLNLLKKELKGEQSSPSVSFPLKGKLSLSSKNEQQLVKVEKFTMPAKFYNVATPLLTNYVFREAEILNESLETLLEGPANVYLDERYVGKAEISNIAKGQNFIMGFGIDSQIKAKRELVEKKEKILGGNKEITFKVRIILENFYKKNMDLRVLDRIPAEDEKENIRITLDLKANSLSRDEQYTQYERPKGILRWDTALSGESSAGRAKVIEYTYKLEHDKNLGVTAPSAQKTDQMRLEFDEIQKLKHNRK